MFKKPCLAIIGRPNVGKSALFNRLCKRRIAIVDEAEGITRDRLYAEAEAFGFSFTVVDTGGIDIRSTDQFRDEIRRQAELAIVEADTLVMVVDGKVGMTETDQELAKILLKTGKPLCLAVNKIDDFDQEYLIHHFYPLGITKIIGISAAQGLQIAELIEAAWEGFKPPEEIKKEEDGIKIAIVGRPNTGKSTLVNALLQEERCIVSPLAGTTRDSIDIPVTVDGASYVLIDTAGIRRKQKELEVVDKFAFIRTEKAIERCDLCLLLIDAEEGMTAQEKKIVNLIEAAGKGCIILLNKWDLVKGFRMEHCMKALHDESPFLANSPILFISAKTGRNLEKVFPEALKVYEALTTRVTTGQLNKFLERAMQLNHPPMIRGKRLRIYYMTQVEVLPPKFILFVNHPDLMTDTYKKYLLNRFREHFSYPGVPIQIHLKGKEKKIFTHGHHDEED